MTKYGPPAVALSFPEQLLRHFDPVEATALLVGLLAGVLWRAGDRRAKGETWSGIFDDLTVSCLIGLSNLIAAAIVVNVVGVPPLYAIGVAMVIAGKGPDAMAWFAERYMPGRRGGGDGRP